jgi:predicted kinase
MNKIKILIGVSGTGKSTWSSMFTQANPSYKIVSRDKIREMLFGYSESTVSEYYKLPNIKENETLVTHTQNTLTKQILAQGYDVLIDNTHLDYRYIQELYDDYLKCEFTHKVFGYDFTSNKVEDGLLTRLYAVDSTRSKPVGRKVLDKQFSQFTKLMEKHHHELQPDFVRPPLDYFSFKDVIDSSKYPVVICDLDGTIADNSHRPSYGFDVKLIRKDAPIQPVIDIINDHYISSYREEYKSNSSVIFVSGRTDDYYGETFNWLVEHTKIQPKDITLYMRKSGDFRKDTVVKREIFFNEIQPHHSVWFAIDDRPSIVNMWYNLGIFCLNVNQSGREF